MPVRAKTGADGRVDSINENIIQRQLILDVSYLAQYCLKVVRVLHGNLVGWFNVIVNSTPAMASLFENVLNV